MQIAVMAGILNPSLASAAELPEPQQRRRLLNCGCGYQTTLEESGEEEGKRDIGLAGTSMYVAVDACPDSVSAE